MVNMHFIDNPGVLAAIQAIMSVAGKNYNAPYDAQGQPTDGGKRNTDDLLQYQLPGGATLQGYADPSQSESMGTSINSLLAAVAPFISAYGLILPILGIIRGLIEIICALMNPFAVIAAVIRLFVKWIPPFISIFPPLAGVIIILSTIKVILAVVFFVLTVLLPMIQLIIFNIKLLATAFGADGNKQQQDAGREKLIAMLIELANQLGVLALLKPLMEIIFLILGMVAGFPCSGGKGKKGKTTMLKVKPSGDADGTSDATCCTDNVCPPVFKNLPKGRALVIPSFFADGPPLFAWRIITLTGNSRMKELKPYTQSLKPQLDAQLDEPVDEARSAGQSGDSAHFRIKLTGRRGGGQTKIAPLAKLRGKKVTAIDPSMILLMGVVSYEIVPNWEILIGRNIVGLGCHPDVSGAMETIRNRFPDLEDSVIDKFPEVGPVKDDFNDMVNNVNNLGNALINVVLDTVFENGEGLNEDGEVIAEKVPVIQPPSFAIDMPDRDEPVGLTFPVEVLPTVDFDTGTLANAMSAVPYTNPNTAKLPYNDALDSLDAIQDAMTELLTDFADDMKGIMNRILSKATDRINSDFDVDKNLVKAGITDKAMIAVIPRDLTGSPLLKDLPDGVSISVSLFTDFGTIANQKTDTELGVVTADITSPFPGEATLTAKVNTEYITEFTGETERTKELKVKFVSDAVMPKRRFVSKLRTTSTKLSTVNKHEREPGGK